MVSGFTLNSYSSQITREIRYRIPDRCKSWREKEDKKKTSVELSPTVEMNREPNYKIAYHAQTAMNNIFRDIVSLFTLGSIYSTKASEAERITETNTNLYET